MFRLWGKLIKNNRIITDHVFELDAPSMAYDDKVEEGMSALCYHFDIQKPLWLEENNEDFPLRGKTRFKDDHFMEEISFDYFEIEIIENK